MGNQSNKRSSTNNTKLNNSKSASKKRNTKVKNHDLADILPYDLAYASFAQQNQSRFIVCGGNKDGDTKFFEIICNKTSNTDSISFKSFKNLTNADLSKINIHNGNTLFAFLTDFEKRLVVIDRDKGYNVYDFSMDKWLLKSNYPLLNDLKTVQLDKWFMRTLFIEDILLIVSIGNKILFLNFNDILLPRLIKIHEIGAKYLGHGLCLTKFEISDENGVTEKEYKEKTQTMANKQLQDIDSGSKNHENNYSDKLSCYKMTLLIFGGSQAFCRSRIEIIVIVDEKFERIIKCQDEQLVGDDRYLTDVWNSKKQVSYPNALKCVQFEDKDQRLNKLQSKQRTGNNHNNMYNRSRYSYRQSTSQKSAIKYIFKSDSTILDEQRQEWLDLTKYHFSVPDYLQPSQFEEYVTSKNVIRISQKQQQHGYMNRAMQHFGYQCIKMANNEIIIIMIGGMSSDIEKSLIFWNVTRNEVFKLNNILPIECPLNPMTLLKSIQSIQQLEDKNGMFYTYFQILLNNAPLVKVLNVPNDVLREIVHFLCVTNVLHIIYKNRYFEIPVSPYINGLWGNVSD